ncbi:MAG: AAA family ATPase, partial [Pseudomonadales bacterium]
MYIKRIAVDAWRGLSCELGDLSPGLNLICGPNESGKSRLVQALRFALFESSSGRAEYKRAVETWGVTDGKPRVEVEFELAGASWMLEKTFLGTGCNTVLRGAGKSLEGEEAEARLADLMGVSPGGRTELKSNERGIWSLLWVDQGESREAPGHNDVARARIQDQLTAEIGEIAAGELGQRLLRRAREHRELFYTASRDTEKPVLRDARDKLEQARARLEEAEAAHRAVADAADALDGHRQREAGLRQRVDQARIELAEISDRQREAAEAAQHLDRCGHQLELAKLELDRKEQDWQGFAELAAQRLRLTAEIATLEGEQATAAALRQTAESAQLEANAAVTAADDALTALGRDLYLLRQRQKAAALGAEQSQLNTRLHEAQSLSHRLGEVRAELAALPAVQPGDVERLRAARQAAEAAHARLEGASASLEFHAHRELQIDGTTVAAGAAHTVLIEDETHLEIDGVLSLLVRPGGGELARLRTAVGDADRALASLLSTL